MGLSVYTAATSEPITLVEAKGHLRIDGSDEDGLLAGYIFAAREFIENETHLRLITQTLDYTIDDYWPRVSVRGCMKTRIELPVKPVASITSITYVDENGTTQTLASNQYTLRKDGPVHFVEPAYNATWPTVRGQTAAITVRFVAGTSLSDVPNSLIQAMRLLISHADKNREAVSDGKFVEVPLGVEAYISPYRFTRF